MEKNNKTKFIALSGDGKKHKFIFKDNKAIEHNNKKVDITIEEINGISYVVFNKKKFPVEITEKNQNKYTVLINNVSYDFSIETPTSFRRRKFLDKKHQNQQNDQLVAPMPGKIVEILIDEESNVKEGDPILILEAMKMQNEIIAQNAGKVKKINVRPGDNVMKDDILIEFHKN